jgi:hypothetical protein
MMRINSEKFQEFLTSQSVEIVERFDTKTAGQLRSEWKNTFAFGFRVPTGGLFWHVFTYEHAVYITGKQALRRFNEESPVAFVVFPSPSADSTCYYCKAEKMPDFSEYRDDLFVCNRDLDWTMACTHEEGLGPFYSRKEWQTWYTGS